MSIVNEPIDMSDENKAKFNAMIDRINAMDRQTILELVQAGKCPYEPEHLIGVPLGMFHCEVCGEMVVAGCEHPRPLDEGTAEAYDEADKLGLSGFDVDLDLTAAQNLDMAKAGFQAKDNLWVVDGPE